MHVSMETEECIDRIENRAKTKKYMVSNGSFYANSTWACLGAQKDGKKGKRKKIVHRSYNSFYFCDRVTME